MIARIANRILPAAASHGTWGRPVGSPIIIAIDGPPGSGKTTFARALTDYINNSPPTGGIKLAAQRVKTDWALKLAPQSLSCEELAALPEEECSLPGFWYDFSKIQTFMDQLGHMFLGGELPLGGLYREGAFDYSQRTTFSPGSINFLVLEGCYSLHRALNTGDYFGVFMWSAPDQRKAQFIKRSLERGRSLDASKALFKLTSDCYVRYLREKIDFEGLWHRLFLDEQGNYHLSYNGNTDNIPFFLQRAGEIAG